MLVKSYQYSSSIRDVSIASLLLLDLASAGVDTKWHAPQKSDVNSLSSAINGTGVYGFIFDTSNTPSDKYGIYNWCNMPHVRKQEYKKPKKPFELQYVELIHRHHKRTPYAANTFPKESYSWDCSDEGLFFYGKPFQDSKTARPVYWQVYTSPNNPFPPQGFNGTCQFPQISKGGLDDSWQHGRDLFEVYHDLLKFIPSTLDKTVSYRVTNNVITSQVAGMVVNGMYGSGNDYSVLIQPNSIDSLEPTYSCSAATNIKNSYQGSNPAWTEHLTASSSLHTTLDAISGIKSSQSDWFVSWDHYYDNLSARLCHSKPLPCSLNDPSKCITQSEADEVFRLGQWEYSYNYRDAPQSLAASTAGYGVWIAELAANIRAAVSGDGKSGQVKYRHNVAHDGSVSRLLSILQVEQMVWPGMGSEVVFEIWKDHSKAGKKGSNPMDAYALRVLWGGKVLRSSNPSLGVMDMVPVIQLLAYIDALVGVGANKVPELCSAT